MDRPLKMDTVDSEDDGLKDVDMDIMRLALGSEELLKNSTKTF